MKKKELAGIAENTAKPGPPNPCPDCAKRGYVVCVGDGKQNPSHGRRDCLARCGNCGYGVDVTGILKPIERRAANQVLQRLISDYSLIRKPAKGSPLELTGESKDYNIFAADLHKWAVREGKRWADPEKEVKS